MNFFDYLIIVIIISFLAGVFDRLREITRIDIWFNNSWMSRATEKIKRWLRSEDKDEIRYWKITIFGKELKIRLHPVFWDGYHNFKNVMVFLLVGSLGISLIGWWFPIGYIAWYIGQELTLNFSVDFNKIEENKSGNTDK